MFKKLFSSCCGFFAKKPVASAEAEIAAVSLDKFSCSPPVSIDKSAETSSVVLSSKVVPFDSTNVPSETVSPVSLGSSLQMSALSIDTSEEFSSALTSPVTIHHASTAAPSVATTPVSSSHSFQKPRLSIDVSDPDSPDLSPKAADTVVDDSNSSRNEWLRNIERIKSSEYYNAIVDMKNRLSILDIPKEKRTPYECYAVKLFDTPNSGLSCVSPLSLGKKFEFMRSPSQKDVQAIDHFMLSFQDRNNKKLKKFNFVVTNRSDVVVVETEGDFFKAILFQESYGAAAKQYGFVNVVWIDPEAKVQQGVAVHPDFIQEGRGLSMH